MEKIKRIISKIFKKGEPDYKDKYKNEEPWIPGGEGEKEKIKVTPEELGKALCGFCNNMAYKYLDDKETLKVLGIGKSVKYDLLKKYYFLEIIATSFFLNILQIDELFKDEKIKNRILDSMHEAHYKFMDLDEAGINSTKEYFAKKYKEYTDATKEKRGPNWLWPLTHRVLNNLRQEETEDAFAMMGLSSLLSSITKGISDLIKNKYKIIKG